MSIITAVKSIVKMFQKNPSYILFNLGSFQFSTFEYEQHKKMLWDLMSKIEDLTCLKFDISSIKESTIIDIYCYQSDIDDVLMQVADIDVFLSADYGSKPANDLAKSFLVRIKRQLNSVIAVKKMPLSKQVLGFLNSHKSNNFLDYYIADKEIYVSIDIGCNNDMLSANIKEALTEIIAKEGLLEAADLSFLLISFFDKGEMPHKPNAKINLQYVEVDLFAYLMFERFMDINSVNFYLQNNWLHIYTKDDGLLEYLKGGDESLIKYPSPDIYLKELYNSF